MTRRRGSRGFVRVLVAAAVAGAASMIATPATAGTPAAKPGDVIQATPITAPAGAHAWKIRYHSRALDGRDITVSGIVVAPDGPAPKGGRPVVTWAHGTTGLADRCAPSQSAAAGTALPWEQDLLTRGYVLAATDYEGLGTSGPHPYLVGESEGRGVLDAARAARRVGGAQNRAGAGRDVTIIGHSQGGHAALFAGEIAPAYAPELHVRGVVALAPAPDPALVLAGARLSSKPLLQGFAAMVVAGVQAAFPKADADALLTPAARRALQRVQESGCTAAVFAALNGITALQADPNTVPAVKQALARSAPGHVATKAPMLVLQGDVDQVVPEASTQAFVTRACAVGDLVDFQRFPTADHTGVLAAGAPTLLAWLDARATGTAPTDTC